MRNECNEQVMCIGAALLYIHANTHSYQGVIYSHVVLLASEQLHLVKSTLSGNMDRKVSFTASHPKLTDIHNTKGINAFLCLGYDSYLLV